MIVSEKYRFVYLAVPKTGSTTVENVLVEHYGAFRHDAKHSTAIPAGYQDYFVFATVRNPYERALSAWAWGNRIRKRSDDWHAYVEQFFFVSVSTFLSRQVTVGTQRPLTWGRYADLLGSTPGPRVDQFVPLEGLEDCFSSLPFVTGRIQFPVANSNRYHKALPQDGVVSLFQFVRRNYAEDFARFGYPTDPSAILSKWAVV